MPHAGQRRSIVAGARRRRTPRDLHRALTLGALAVLLLAFPVVRAATANDSQPGQRIDLKVLLVSADGTEPGFGAWQAALDREGVPYDTFVAYNGQAKAATLTDDRLADYAAGHAKYQAVILATGDLGRNLTNRNDTTSYLSAFSDAEWEVLARFERTFGDRQLSDFTAPSPTHGLNVVGGANQDGSAGTLTAAGKAAFPYLKGPIPISDDSATVIEAFGYQATPANAANWQTLVAAPTAGAAYLGIYTHPEDGHEEMVMTLASNQYQSHNQALRHGMLTWVTRGVFLGYQRAYLGLDVDDIFLPDDKWDAAANVTDYTPESAIRMAPTDVDTAVAWQNRTGLRLNMVYNMGGVDEFGVPAGNDALLAKFQTVKNQFRWINHTLQHPNLDCTTEQYTRNQLVQNQVQFNALLGPVDAGLNDPTEAITGEHSGLANIRPGNPGTIDPPSFDELEPTIGGSLPVATYDYAITASSPAGESVASIATVTVEAGESAVRADFNEVCHAIAFNLYRRISPAGSWVKVRSESRNARAPVDDGSAPIIRSITDTGTTDAAGAPPATNLAALAPYTQNPNYIPALTAAGIKTVASDSSKGYPNPPTKDPVSETDPTNFAKGATFAVGPARAVPRYPSNVYYNVANRADQLDEYNWIYTAPPAGGCVAIPNVTTCNAAPVDWAYYLASETRIMLGHLTGNDPRPHYFHQTNIAQSDPNAPATATNVGGTLYAVIDTLLARYDQVFDRASAPLLQVTQQQAADTLLQQDTWVATRASGVVSSWLQDGKVHIVNTGASAVEVPITGTPAGTLYGGQRSGWISVAPGEERVLEATELAKSPPRPAVEKKAAPKPVKAVRLALTRVRMSPRRFAVAHKRRKLGTRLDGSTITWRLNKAARVTLKFQRPRGSKKHRRWVKVGTIKRSAKQGKGIVRFRGRFGTRLLKPHRYRMVVTAKHRREHSGPKRVRFRVVKG
jgi:hypothetical protein